MEYIIESDVKESIKRLPELSIEPISVHLLMMAIRSRKARKLLDTKMKDLVVERKIIRPIPDWKNRYFNTVYNMAVLQFNGKYNVKNIIVPKEVLGYSLP